MWHAACLVEGVLRIAAALIVTLVTPPLLPLCAAPEPAAHDCCRKATPASQMQAPRPCCAVRPAPGLPPEKGQAVSAMRLVAAAAAIERAPISGRDTPAAEAPRSTRTPTYLRHVTLRI